MLGTIGGGQSTTSSTSNNSLNINGGSTTIDPGTKFSINGTSLSFITGQTYSYKIAQGAGDQHLLNINSTTSPSQISFANFTNSSSFEFSVTGDSGGIVYMNIAPVPEPAAVLLIAFGALGVGRLIRRRRSDMAK